MRNVGSGLLARIDNALDAALEAVRGGDAVKATVAVTFTVGLDKDGDEVTLFALKHARTEQGDWHPQRQARLPLEEDDEARRIAGEFFDKTVGDPRSGIAEVTLSSGGKSVTLHAPAGEA